MRTGETLFVPGRQCDELRAFGARYRIPLVQRTYVWDLLLEPYVSTEFTDAADRRTREELLAIAFTDEEITEIRARFGPAMTAYNGVLWDWVHLGLYDLLLALTGALTEREYALGPDEYRQTYWWAMEVADRGREPTPRAHSANGR